MNAIRDLKRDASCGVPLSYSFKDNEQFLSSVAEMDIVQHVWERLCKLSADCDYSQLSARQLVAEGLTDPVRVFVKGELHSAEKVAQGRMRLISVLSTTDQVIERVLHACQNHEEIAQWTDIPSKPGMGLDDPSLDALRDEILMFADPVDTDISGWDWGVPGWLMQAEVEVRVALAGCDSTDMYSRLVLNRFLCISLSVMVLSDGTVWEQKYRGIQKSGSYCTSSGNSRMRVLLAYMAGASKAIAMGDDCVEEFSPTAESFYSEHVLIKGYVSAWDPSKAGTIEFCSMEFNLLDTKKPYRPTREERQLATLLWKTPISLDAEEELVCALVNDTRHSEIPLFAEAGQLTAALARWGWGAGKVSQVKCP